MSGETKQYSPGDVITIRTKKDTPTFIMSLINDTKAQGGTGALLDHLISSMKQTGVNQKKGIYLPLPPGVTQEEIGQIEDNEPLMNLIANIIKTSISLDSPLQFPINHAIKGNEEATTKLIAVEGEATAPSPPPSLPMQQEAAKKPPRAKAKRMSALKSSGLTDLKNSFNQPSP
ncbi:hypothetical protein J2Z48_002932 [Croceifilum oryzae]|uniref:Uncharacterized protein n=1 Tax=Croceifilum oryzae TaxID=1553429 RepID=A0AAJ1TH22_9BACL|nr:hypothetical protein [Croceifilum oryzae]MDQ0418728.1 hypothetical protein [Croceifilum oryzae]